MLNDGIIAFGYYCVWCVLMSKDRALKEKAFGVYSPFAATGKVVVR